MNPIRYIKKRVGIHVYNKYILPKLLDEIKRKKVLTVAFSAWNVSMWKYHSLYKAMEAHPRFDPVVVLVPSPGKGEETQTRDLEEMKAVFTARGYNVHPEIQRGAFGIELDITPKPDIIFVTQPYSPSKLTRFARRSLFCYAPYGFPRLVASNWMDNTFMQNIFWKIFYPKQENVDSVRVCAYNKGTNCVVTGYTFGDELSSAHSTLDVWKRTEPPGKKRIIWAPHASIKESSKWKVSTFLLLHRDMLDLARKHADRVQWTFKPHPWLFQALCREKTWGADRTKAYFKEWESLPDAQVELGGYTGQQHLLFLNREQDVQ